MRRGSGFTLIELMIVVSIVGLLSAIAIPKFADMVRKAREGSTKGNLGALRSAISIYYGDNEGWYPTGAAGYNTTFLQSSLTTNGKYMSAFPKAAAGRYHSSINTVDTLNNDDAYAADPGDDGEWVYVSNSSNGKWGKIFMECYHTDAKGTIWSTY